MAYYLSRSLLFCLCLFSLPGCQPSSSTKPDLKMLVASRKDVTSSGTTNFSSKEGAFSVYFPAKPTTKRKTSGGSRQVRYTCKIGSVTYAIDAGTIPHTARPDDTDTPDKLKKGFDRIQNSLVKRMGGKLETSRDVVLNGVPGRRYRARIASLRGAPVLCTMHIYMAPNFSYLVMVMGFEKDCRTQRAQTEKFLGSFRPIST